MLKRADVHFIDALSLNKADTFFCASRKFFKSKIEVIVLKVIVYTD